MADNLFSSNISLSNIIAERSLYILKHKFSIFNKNIINISEKYTEFSDLCIPKNYINKIKKYHLINLKSLSDCIIEIFENIKIIIYKLNNVNDLYYNELISPSLQKKININVSAEIINFLIHGNNVIKYNQLFLNKYISPSIQLKENYDPNKVIFDRKYNENVYIDTKEFESKIYVEVLVNVISDFIKNYSGFVVIDTDNKELKNEVKQLYDKEIFSMLSQNETSTSTTNLKDNIKGSNKSQVNDAAKLNKKLLYLNNNISVYEKLYKEKKLKGGNTDYIEDMINKLKSIKASCLNLMNESNSKNKKLIINKLNGNKRFNKRNKDLLNSYNTYDNVQPLKSLNIGLDSSLSDRNSNKINFSPSINESIDLKNLPPSEEEIETSLNIIYNFYTKTHKSGTSQLFDFYLNKRDILLIDEYFKFCKDFNIKLERTILNKVFHKYNNPKDGTLNFEGFKNIINSLSLELKKYEMDTIHKKIIKLKEKLKTMENKNELDDSYKLRSNFSTDKSISNSKSNNYKSHRISTKEAKEIFTNEKKYIQNEIIKYQNNYNKLIKYTNKNTYDYLINYLGINSNQDYINKMEGVDNNKIIAQSVKKQLINSNSVERDTTNKLFSKRYRQIPKLNSINMTNKSNSNLNEISIQKEEIGSFKEIANESDFISPLEKDQDKSSIKEKNDIKEEEKKEEKEINLEKDKSSINEKNDINAEEKKEEEEINLEKDKNSIIKKNDTNEEEKKEGEVEINLDKDKNSINEKNDNNEEKKKGEEEINLENNKKIKENSEHNENKENIKEIKEDLENNNQQEINNHDKEDKSKNDHEVKENVKLIEEKNEKVDTINKNEMNSEIKNAKEKEEEKVDKIDNKTKVNETSEHKDDNAIEDKKVENVLEEPNKGQMTSSNPAILNDNIKNKSNIYSNAKNTKSQEKHPVIKNINNIMNYKPKNVICNSNSYRNLNNINNNINQIEKNNKFILNEKNEILNQIVVKDNFNKTSSVKSNQMSKTNNIKQSSNIFKNTIEIKEIIDQRKRELELKMLNEKEKHFKERKKEMRQKNYLLNLHIKEKEKQGYMQEMNKKINYNIMKQRQNNSKFTWEQIGHAEIDDLNLIEKERKFFDQELNDESNIEDFDLIKHLFKDNNTEQQHTNINKGKNKYFSNLSLFNSNHDSNYSCTQDKYYLENFDSKNSQKSKIEKNTSDKLILPKISLNRNLSQNIIQEGGIIESSYAQNYLMNLSKHKGYRSDLNNKDSGKNDISYRQQLFMQKENENIDKYNLNSDNRLNKNKKSSSINYYYDLTKPFIHPKKEVLSYNEIFTYSKNDGESKNIISNKNMLNKKMSYSFKNNSEVDKKRKYTPNQKINVCPLFPNNCKNNNNKVQN